MSKYLGVEVQLIEDTLPDQVLLLFAPQRSGSTLCLDAIRCHPLIELWHSSSLFSYLVGNSVRYPNGLSQKLNGSQIIDSRHHSRKYQRIPLFDISKDIGGALEEGIRESFYAIEKFHPVTIGNKTENLLQSLKSIEFLKPNIKIRHIYVVRKPKDMIGSYLSYNKRNKLWGPLAGNPQQLFIAMRDSYRCLYEVSMKRPGLVIDYLDLQNDLEKTMKKIYFFLWPDANSGETELIDQVSRFAINATKREKRPSNTTFFGKEEGTYSYENEYGKLFEKYAEELTEINKFYNWLCSSTLAH